MKRYQFLIFYSIVIIIYSLLNYYVFIRGYQVVAIYENSNITTGYIAIYLFIAALFPLGWFTGRKLPYRFSNAISTAGGLWLGSLLYFILFILVLDFTRYLGNSLTLFPEVIIRNYDMAKSISFLTIFLITFMLVSYGYYNAGNYKVNKTSIEIEKAGNEHSSIHLVFASDIHLGNIIGIKSLKKIVHIINNLNPDIVLFPGDIVDENIEPVITQDMGNIFKELNPPLGIFASTGNHEFIGGANKAINYLENYGIKFLRDESVIIHDTICIAGREDITLNSFEGKKRKSLHEILKDCPKYLPVVVMDHQPINMSEAAENEVDLQISGHTHNGQMWPLNFITRASFKKSWGHTSIGNTHFFVSSGAGTWGPRVKIGSNAEIVSIKIKFK